jgi:hypothetical protein
LLRGGKNTNQCVITQIKFKNYTLYLKVSKISISFYTALPSNVNLADKNTVNNILAERSAQFDF